MNDTKVCVLAKDVAITGPQDGIPPLCETLQGSCASGTIIRTSCDTVVISWVDFFILEELSL